MRLLVSTIMVAAATLAASCSTAATQPGASPKAQRELASALAGRVAQPAVRCLPAYRTTQSQIIDDWTILYRDGRTVYVQHPRGGCRGIGLGGYTMVQRKFGTSDSCDGDIVHLVDLRSGIAGGSCILGPFIPYTRR